MSDVPCQERFYRKDCMFCPAKSISLTCDALHDACTPNCQRYIAILLPGAPVSMGDIPIDAPPSGVPDNGLKFDDGKPRWDLLPWEQIEEIVKVFTQGAKKYGDNNWKAVKNGKDRYFAALHRHLVAYRTRGNVNVEDFGFSHLAHAAWNILALMYFESRDTLTPAGTARYASTFTIPYNRHASPVEPGSAEDLHSRGLR